MASKVAEVKESQGFQINPKWPKCGTCPQYTSRGKTSWGEDRHKRCSLGNFAVGRGGVCNHHPDLIKMAKEILRQEG